MLGDMMVRSMVRQLAAQRVVVASRLGSVQLRTLSMMPLVESGQPREEPKARPSSCLMGPKMGERTSEVIKRGTQPEVGWTEPVMRAPRRWSSLTSNDPIRSRRHRRTTGLETCALR